MKRSAPFTTLILTIWAVLVVIAVTFANTYTNEEISPVYKTMVEAAEIAEDAMEAVKAEKVSRGIELNELDILETGMLGAYYTSITTTRGVLEAKRTSANPNWAAVVVGMFRRANLRAGDQVAMVFSGSFPALNICVMAAAQAYGLEQYVMASIGASNYGATNEDFTFFDMAEFLYAGGILTHRLDCVSLGGDSDIGRDFYDDDVKTQILDRIEASGVTFIYESDYEKNIDTRLGYIERAVPDIKFMVNVGGSLVALGTGVNAFLNTGYVKPYSNYAFSVMSWGKRDEGCGLLQYFLAQGLPVASFLNLKGLALDYGIPYDPVEKQQIGVGEVYYTKTYDPIVPIIALVISVGVAVFCFLYRRHSGENERKDEKNYILYRR